MEHDNIVYTKGGNGVLTYALREYGNPLNIIAQKGCQEKFLSSPADITIFGGNRGGGKSWALLMEVLKDIQNPNFAAVILRNEKEDLSNMVNKSYELFSQFGKYNRSISDMTWNFYTGGFLKFSYYADSFEDFVKRFQGKEFSFIGIDEITHSDYNKFKYLITNNRNAYGIRNRFYGTCNPDPDSWVRKFIDWWIDGNGNPIPERDGIVRYCFMDGDRPEDIYWGDSVEEVYVQCKHIIDPLLTPGLVAK